MLPASGMADAHRPQSLGERIYSNETPHSEALDSWMESLYDSIQLNSLVLLSREAEGPAL